MTSIENPFSNVIEDMVYCLENDATPRVDGIEGRRTVALLEDIYRSSRTGASVDCTEAPV